MSDIASKIAAEHEFGMFECQCGEPVADWNHMTRREMRELHTAHIARVAEAAVRAQIVADIEAARPEVGPGVLITERRTALRDGMDRAARIAEGGTQ